MQDGAPTYIVKTVCDWLDQIFPGHVGWDNMEHMNVLQEAQI